VALTFLVLTASPLQNWGQAAERIGTVRLVEGMAEARAQAATTWRLLRLGETIALGDTVRTEADSMVEVWLQDRSLLTLSARSELQFSAFLLTQQQQRTVVHLRLGTLKVDAPCIRAESVIEVHTPNTVVSACGTTSIVHFMEPDTARAETSTTECARRARSVARSAGNSTIYETLSRL
jgi:ferric-dicitrate binding protein FerR (iron transport regulator)